MSKNDGVILTKWSDNAVVSVISNCALSLTCFLKRNIKGLNRVHGARTQIQNIFLVRAHLIVEPFEGSHYLYNDCDGENEETHKNDHVNRVSTGTSTVIPGKICYTPESLVLRENKLVVPESVRNIILQKLHTPQAGIKLQQEHFMKLGSDGYLHQ